MSDPLSVTASIAGIVAVAAKLTHVILDVSKRAKGAPEACDHVISEVHDVRNILNQLQSFILGASRASRCRMSLIMVDDLVTALASCVQTFSELDAFTQVLQSDFHASKLDRLRWVAKEKQLQELVGRLQMRKSTLSLILQILTCQRQNDAVQKVEQLQELIEQLLRQNTFIAQRLDRSEYTQSAEPHIEIRTISRPMSLYTPSTHEIEYRAPALLTVGLSASILPFEKILKGTRVYQRAHDREERLSVISMSTRTGKWSALSGLSLSEVSDIAVLALPIYPSDLSNAEEYAFRVPLHDDRNTDDDYEMPYTYEDFCALAKPRSRENASIYNYDSVFGTTLMDSVTCSSAPILFKDMSNNNDIYCTIPWIVVQVGLFIKERGLFTKDIFVSPGHPARIASLARMFNENGRPGRGHFWTGYTAYDAADVLLCYLESLNEPIIPSEYFDRFTSVIAAVPSKSSKTEQALFAPDAPLRGLHVMITKLSRRNRLLLLYLLDLMDVVSWFSESTENTRTSLAYTFQPAILARAKGETTTPERRLATRTLEFLIENHSGLYFFDKDISTLLGPRIVGEAADRTMRTLERMNAQAP